jgi:hypothetical protein
MQASRKIPDPAPIDYAALNHALRHASPPFDGLEDLLNWLDLRTDFDASSESKLRLHVATPADVSLDDTSVENGVLNLTIAAHPKCDVATLSVAVRGAPGKGITTRQQVADNIKWEEPNEMKRIGKARIELTDADAALVMLSVGAHYVRRHWFVDPVRSTNERLLATRLFDGNLKMLRRYLLEEQNQDKFELAVAALLFLSGFAPAIQCETEASDIVVVTPGGRIALVECTLKISDFNTKLGKLVHRREALAQALSTSGRVVQVLSVLACQASRAQIAPDDIELAHKGILVVARESLEQHLNTGLHFPNDADKMYVEYQARLAQLATPSPGSTEQLNFFD